MPPVVYWESQAYHRSFSMIGLRFAECRGQRVRYRRHGGSRTADKPARIPLARSKVAEAARCRREGFRAPLARAGPGSCVLSRAQAPTAPALQQRAAIGRVSAPMML